MTIEEAIEVIKDIYNYTKWDTYTTNEARTMAIKALEQQTCEDAISREEAKNLFWDGTEGYDCRGFTRMEIGEMLDDLPSVQPFSRTFEITYRYERKPVEDCVSRESVIEWLKNRDIIKTKNQEDNARRELQNLPSVTPTRPNSEWIINKDKDTVCSNCEEPIFKYQKIDFDYRPHFCPNCGADMRGDAK